MILVLRPLIVFSGTSASFARIRLQSEIKRLIVVNLIDGPESDLDSPPLDPEITDYTPFADALSQGEKLKFRPITIAREDIAFLQYSGGTTGPSKGAMLTHGNILSNKSQFYECSPAISRENTEVVVTAIPMYHIFALTVNFLIYAGCGSQNVLITNPRDMGGFVSAIKDDKGLY